MASYLSVTDLVTRAKNGEQQAWDGLVERYAPLIWSICRHYRLEAADAEDVGQVVWLKLVTHLDHLREAAALPGWLATTTRRECGRVINAADARRAGERVLIADNIADTETATVEQELLVAEQQAVLRDALARLPPAAGNCSSCSAPTPRSRMPRSVRGSASRSGASDPTADGAWTDWVATR